MNFLIHMHPCSKTWERNTLTRQTWQRSMLYSALNHCSQSERMCKSRSDPKGKHKIEQEMRVMHLHSIRKQIQSWKRKHCARLTCSLYFLHLQRGGTLSGFSQIEERKTEGLTVLNFSSCSLTTLIHAPLGREGMRLHISIKDFLLPLHNNPPIAHFCKRSLLYSVCLNSQASPCRFGDVH